MKRIIMLCLCALFLCSCGTDKKELSTDRVITCSQKDELVKDGAILIDVRTAQEYAEGNLEGSINLTVDTISINIEKLVPDKNATIVVYCRSGNRSATAKSTLNSLGYKNVYDLGAMGNCAK